MHTAFFLRGMLLWAGFVLLGAASGAVRAAWTQPALGPDAQYVHLVALTACVVLLTHRLLRRFDAAPALLWRMGVMWAALSVALHLGLGRLVFERPLAALVAEYDLTAGSLFPVFLLILAVTPRCAALLSRP